MISLDVATIAHAIDGTIVGSVPTDLVTGQVHTDSRQIQPGDCFVAINGDCVDGHRFAQQAAEAGAAIVISEQDIQTPHIRVKSTVTALGKLAAYVLATLRAAGPIEVVGVTGSSGKTTTKDMLHAILSTAGPTVAPVSSFNNDIGLPLTVLRCDMNTRYLVAEMGASAVGELTRLTTICPLDIACVLMVGHAHLGGFGSIDDVATAKSELVRNLPSHARIVLNADDSRVAAMARRASVAGGTALPSEQVFWFSATKAVPVGGYATDVSCDSCGRASFTAVFDQHSEQVNLAIPGVHHVNNALAALTAAWLLGVDMAAAAAAVGTASISAHRMALTQRPDGITIVDDAYNANPESMRASLRTVADMPATRHIAVLGSMLEMGHQAPQAHFDIGELAGQLGYDWVISLTEPDIAAGAASAGVPRVDSAENCAEISALLQADWAAGDTVVLKGSNGTRLWSVADELTQIPDQRDHSCGDRQ